MARCPWSAAVAFLGELPRSADLGLKFPNRIHQYFLMITAAGAYKRGIPVGQGESPSIGWSGHG
jgi:hypothetical protein